MKEWQNSILTGDCLEVLAELPDESVHMCMTSPPYFGLRDYSVDGQIGLEDTLEEYISELVAVGDALQRVLRDDGSWWLNLGDTYAGTGTDRKNKMLVPHRVAIALQEAGWTVRNDVTWVKPNPMPQSVTDRLNTTTEQIFHLVPEADYWYDLDAVREPHAESTYERGAASDYDTRRHTAEKGKSVVQQDDVNVNPSGKNPGDVFEVTTKPFPDAHFAVYPPELCEKPIKATCPPKVCIECGSPYERDVERTPGEYDYSERGEEVGNGQQASGQQLAPPTAELKGWTPTCDCDTDETESGICLDPFAGAGTTLLKAKELGRKFIGIELNPEYADMARGRIGLSPNDPSNVRDADTQTGLGSYGGGDDG